MKPKPSLPTRYGVSPSFVWLPAGPWQTIGEFFALRFPTVSASHWQSRMQKGEVRDERGNAISLISPYRTGACVFYYREPEFEAPIPFEEIILFRNEQILVVDKPPFLPVTPGGRFLHESLLVRLKKKTGIVNLVPIHRLDRDTAGVMIFSVDPATRNLWQSMFRERHVKKIYEAHAHYRNDIQLPMTLRLRIVQDDKFFRMKATDGDANSETHIALLSRHDGYAHYQLVPVTGKMHQLRVHMNSLGIPILNDRFYPVALPSMSDNYDHPLKLLARSLSFKDPLSDKECFFESQRRL